MPKFDLLILDAGIVIKLFELGLWDRVVSTSNVHLSRIVAEQEADFHSPKPFSPHGQPIDLKADIAAGRCHIFECSLGEIRKFRANFDANYAADLDPGEAESLTWLFNQPAEHLICSGDAIVYRVIGNSHRQNQGISLQEILDTLGVSKNLSWQYTKAFREQYANLGFTDRMQNRGLRMT